MKRNVWIASLAACAAYGAFAVFAADHVETPTVTADPAADIADVYIFRPDQSASRLVAGITFAGRSAATAGGVRIDGPTIRCDRNVLYELNIDNKADGNLDAQPDIQVLARLARNGNDQCGVKIEGIPGNGGRAISGPVETILTDPTSGLRAYAGLVDDPFFFDTIGFAETLSTFAADGPSGQIKILNTRDAFAGRNISVIVFEMDLAAATGGNPSADPVIKVWGDTFRFAGSQP